MLSYVTVGTNDLEAAAKFYDGIAAILGGTRAMENERVITWAAPGKGAMFGVIKPFDGKEAAAGNGTMFGLPAANQEQVQQVYDYALANGGSDEGAPGLRGETFFGAYFRDPEGNKLVTFVASNA
jgi:predicted lactoylglutathione lyase